jgi:hypothetical protein
VDHRTIGPTGAHATPTQSSKAARRRRQTATSSTRGGGPQTFSFSGSGQTNINATVRLSADGKLTWRCAGCSRDPNVFFIVTDDPQDVHAVSVDTTGQASGTLALPSGEYRQLSVLTDGGRWSLRIAPNRRARAGSEPSLTRRSGY